MKVNQSVNLEVRAMTAYSLRAVLETVPPEAAVRIQTHKGDRNESDYHTMTLSWTEER